MEKTMNLENIAENSAILAQPLIAGGAVYVGACETYFYALGLRDGHKIWECKTGGVICSKAVMHRDVLYFGCFDTYLYALDAKNGSILWKFKTGGIVGGSPAIHGSVLFFGSCDNYFYAVSLETQEVLWKFRTGGEIIGTALIDKDRIYFGSQDGYLYCLDLGGNLVWKFRTGGSITIGAPAASEDTVFFASADQNLYALRKSDGSFKWGFRTGDFTFNHPLVSGDFVCLGSRDKYLYVLDQKSGALKWKFCANDRISCIPVNYNNLLIFSSNKVWALDKKGGVVWSYFISQYYGSDGLAASNGILVFGAETGYIHGLDADTGRMLWKFKTKSNALFSPKNVLPPPKWDTELFDKLEGTRHEAKKFEPYTFKTLDAGFFGKEKQKRYVVGEDVEGVGSYKSLEKDASHYTGTAAEAKRRKKEIELIERQFFLK